MLHSLVFVHITLVSILLSPPMSSAASSRGAAVQASPAGCRSGTLTCNITQCMVAPGDRVTYTCSVRYGGTYGCCADPPCYGMCQVQCYTAANPPYWVCSCWDGCHGQQDNVYYFCQVCT